jgi:hypothetical protein
MGRLGNPILQSTPEMLVCLLKLTEDSQIFAIKRQFVQPFSLPKHQK